MCEDTLAQVLRKEVQVKVVCVEHGLDLTQSFGEPRPPGLHISDFYNSYYKALNPKKYGRGGDDPKDLWTLGMAFEDMLEKGFQERLTLAEGSGRPGALKVTIDGHDVWYSPDLLIFNGKTRLGEIKLTFMSPKGHFPWALGKVYDGFGSKADKYLTQMKLYCKCLGTRDARLYAFFVPEAIKATGKALRAWDIRFTQREINEEWDTIMRHVKQEGLLNG